MWKKRTRHGVFPMPGPFAWGINLKYPRPTRRERRSPDRLRFFFDSFLSVRTPRMSSGVSRIFLR